MKFLSTTLPSFLLFPLYVSSLTLPRHWNTTETESQPATIPPDGNNAQPASTWPTKYYNLTLTRGWVDANGEPREAIFVNGQTPGPLIESEEGQELSVSLMP